MRFIHEFRLRLRSLFKRDRVERELSDELRFHLEKSIDEKTATGLARDEARYAALRELGGVEQIKEECRDMRRMNWLADFLQDIRYGFRMLVKNPGFAAVAIVTLGLGIGVNATIFSAVSAMLLRKPPVEDPDRLMMLLSRNGGAASPLDEANRQPVSAPDFLDWRDRVASYSGIAALSSDDFTLSGGTQPERVPGAQVSANYFRVLGVEPVLGRAFLAGEDQAEHAHVVVLHEDLWRDRFGADPQVLGRSVKVNGANYTVIGVMPASFRRMWLFPAKLWIPLVFTPEQLAPTARKSRFLSVFARLKPGVSENQAAAELETIARGIAASHPESNKGWGANVMTVQRYAIQESNSETALLFLTAAVGFVLLIACANIANLLLARNSSRQREFAVRTALGAGGWRLARQLFAECLVLSVAGGGLGLLLAVAGLRVLRARFNWNDYALLTAEMLSIDTPVLFFTLAVSVAAALVFGLAPACQAARRDPSTGLKENSRSASAGRERHRLQNLLVVGELALSIILLVGAGLFVRYFVDEFWADRGMNPAHVLTAFVSLTGPAYKDPARQTTFYHNVLRQLVSFPEVESAAVTSDLPFTFPGSTRFALDGQPMAPTEKQSRAGYFAVSPRYFSVAQIPLLEGREFTLADNSGSAPVVIINEAFARKFFPNQNPLGHHVRIVRGNGPDSGSGGSATPRWSEVVGVVGNVNEYLGQATPRPHAFEPFLQQPDGSMNLVVRLATEPGAFANSLRRAVWSVDKDQPVTNLKTMERVVQDASQGDGLMAELMGAFAAIALLMAAVGIYGLLAHLVGQRTQEFGVRMALGAGRGEIVRLVMRNGVRGVLIGGGIGLLVSLTLPRLFAASFTGFHVRSGLVLFAAPVVVILVALAACYFPARRATKVDPMTALRCE